MLAPILVVLVVAAVLGYFARAVNRVTTHRDNARRRQPTLYRSELVWPVVVGPTKSQVPQVVVSCPRSLKGPKLCFGPSLCLGGCNVIN